MVAINDMGMHLLNGVLVFVAYCDKLPLHSLKETLIRFLVIQVLWQWITLKSTKIK